MQQGLSETLSLDMENYQLLTEIAKKAVKSRHLGTQENGLKLFLKLMQSKKSYDEAIKAAEAAKKSHDPEIRRYADLILSSASYYNWIFS